MITAPLRLWMCRSSHRESATDQERRFSVKCNRCASNLHFPRHWLQHIPFDNPASESIDSIVHASRRHQVSPAEGRCGDAFGAGTPGASKPVRLQVLHTATGQEGLSAGWWSDRNGRRFGVFMPCSPNTTADDQWIVFFSFFCANNGACGRGDGNASSKTRGLHTVKFCRSRSVRAAFRAWLALYFAAFSSPDKPQGLFIVHGPLQCQTFS